MCICLFGGTLTVSGPNLRHSFMQEKKKKIVQIEKIILENI